MPIAISYFHIKYDFKLAFFFSIINANRKFNWKSNTLKNKKYTEMTNTRLSSATCNCLPRKKNLFYFCISAGCVSLTFYVLGSPVSLPGFHHKIAKKMQLWKWRKVLHIHQQSVTVAQKYVNYWFEGRQHIHPSPFSNKIQICISPTWSLKASNVSRADL